MSDHLQVELRKLRRQLSGGYGFDLSRFCAGCWTRLGRVLGRGLCCPTCGKRVCKSCRHFVEEGTWICVLCYKRRFSGEAWWHEDANVQRFKGSQGKSGTYLLRLTDWSSHGVLEAITASDTLGSRIHSFSEESFFTKDPAEVRNLGSKTWIFPGYSTQEHSNSQLTSQIGWNWNQKWRLMTKKNIGRGQTNNLQYTSTTLKNKRREVRELFRMSQKHELSHQVRKSSRRRRHLVENQISNNTDESDSNPTENGRRHLASESISENGNKTRFRKLDDYSHFILDGNRNDTHARMSVRGTRAFGRRKRSRPYPEGHMFESIPTWRSFSLPSELHTSACQQDDEFWRAGFVQSRVRRLEEDLASPKWHDRYDYDFEVQSLCSLELGRILPDSDDYRIAYLSSLESSLDYIEDSISAYGPGPGSLGYKQLEYPALGQESARDLDCPAGGMSTLDFRVKKNIAIEEIHEDEWDMSLSSCDDDDISSSDDEFEYMKVSRANGGPDCLSIQMDNNLKSTDDREESLVDNNHNECSDLPGDQLVNNMRSPEDKKDHLVVSNHDKRKGDSCIDYNTDEFERLGEIDGSTDDTSNQSFNNMKNSEDVNLVVNSYDKKNDYFIDSNTSDEYDQNIDKEIKSLEFEPVQLNETCDNTKTLQSIYSENKNDIKNNILKKSQISEDLKSSCTDSVLNDIHSDSETLVEKDVDCKDYYKTDVSRKTSTTQPVQLNKEEGNFKNHTPFKPEINPSNVQGNLIKITRKIISNDISSPTSYLNKNMTEDSNIQNVKFSNKKLLKNSNFVRNSKFIPKKNLQERIRRTYSISFESFDDKLKEMFHYEPLSTPFAEIYAISCKNPHSAVKEERLVIKDSVTEKTDSNTDLLNDHSFSKIYSTGKLNHSTSSTVTSSNCLLIGNTMENILKGIRFRHEDWNKSNFKSDLKGKIDISDTDCLLYMTQKVNTLSLEAKYLLTSGIEMKKIDIFRTLNNEMTCFPLIGTSLCISPFWEKDIGYVNFEYNSKTFSPNHYSSYLFGVKKFLQKFKTRKNEACSYTIDSHNKITEIAIPLEKLPFHEENYFNNLSDIPVSKFYNFHLIKGYIVPVLHLLSNDNTRVRNKFQPNPNLHRLLKLHPHCKPHLRKRNYPITPDLCGSETKLEIPTESRFAQQSATSQTRQAACAETASWQSQNARECSQARLFSGSVTVPAVERLAERESSSPVWPSTTDGAKHGTTADQTRSLILDYVETDTLDYSNDGDCLFGYPPESSAVLTVATSDGANSSNGVTGLPRNMATCEAEQPRSLGKHVRAQGKNISKLMRLFDSDNNRTNGVTKSDDCNSKKAQQSQCVMDNQRPKDTTASVHNNTPRVVKTLDNSSSSLFVSDGSLNVSNDVKAEKSPSDIPFCRKVPNGGGLWENVNISSANGNGGLWDTSNTTEETCSVTNASSTTELHNLIAVSKAELSRFQEPSQSDKSNLENYFTSFENYKSSSEMSSVSNTSEFHNDPFHSPYDCDTNEMSFEDEEAVMSDTSSDEDFRHHPALTNSNYLPAYALHTIIEESCEESERDSRTTTPTNEANTSKLERYFSWDIINDAEVNMRKKSDDQSTIYSDSLSESSGSVVAEDLKDIDPSHLASSRLEKYFTSGLVDDQNYFYPDDAEFVDDTPVSDFEEDSIHQKISRSALLSSLETMPTLNDACDPSDLMDIKESESLIESKSIDLEICESPSCEPSVAKLDNNCDNVIVESTPQSESTQSLNDADSKDCSIKSNVTHQNFITCSILKKVDVPIPVTSESEDLPVAVEIEISENVQNASVLNNANSESVPSKPVVNKDQLAIDIQAIIKKLLSYFTSETGAETFKDNIENDYISAWQILETEIERLLQSISPNGLENNSCSSSTIDSNNSDYGSDTIESMDCLTDEDDIDAKSRINAKCPLVDMLSSYKIAEPDLSSFNISDETLNIWKRLIMSLQRDNSVLSENKVCDPTAEARLYIRDQIVTLMHTVTVNDSLPEIKPIDIFQTKDVPHSLDKEEGLPELINEAFNVNISNSDILSNVDLDDAVASKAELSSNSIISSENNHPSYVKEDSVTQIDSSCENISDDIDSLCKSINDSITSTPYQANNTSPTISPKPRSRHILKREAPKIESALKFSFVDIELGDENSNSELSQSICQADQTLQQKKICQADEILQPNEVCQADQTLKGNEDTLIEANTSESSPPETTEIFSVPFPFNSVDESQASTSTPIKSSRDTGYYSFKSSDDSLLNTSSPAVELDVPNFKSLKRTVKKFPLASSTLSKSSSNILQSFSAADAKFSTLQLKPKKAKSTLGASSSISPKFSSLFSPSSVLRRITGSRSNETPNAESSIPQKYLKKYARSSSVDNESLFGAVSMPVLNTPRPGDSYSALGLYSENDRDSSLTLDDEAEAKRYFSGSQSVLSLGAHSASMTSVYSAAGCHYGYVTVTGDVLFGLNYNQKSQTMEVFVKQCRNLAAMDVRHNKSNPYVKVYLLPDKTRSGKRKTKTKKNTANPVFNELLRFPVLKNELESRTLWLSVWNSDLFGRNDFLGEISLPLGYRLLDSPTLRWYPLQERAESLSGPSGYRGEVFLALKYVPRDLSLEPRFRPGPIAISARGALHVLIKEARNIATNRRTLDAFCKSYLLPDKSKCTKQKTPVVRRSGHPKWYYTVIYEDLSLDELRGERSLELTLWDHDAIASNRFMGGVRLNAGSGLYHGLSVDWMDSRRDESNLWQAMLDSPNMWVDGCLPLRPTMHFHNS